MRCVAESADQQFDLSSLVTSKDLTISTANGHVFFSLCRPLNKIDERRCPHGAAVCLQMTNGTLLVSNDV